MSKITINKGYIIQKMNGEITIFDGKKSILYTLNETASYIFQKLKLGWDVNRISEKMVKIYRVDQNKARLDIKKSIKELSKKNIVKISA